MQLIEMTRFAVLLALTGVLGWAAVSDVRARQIPNASVFAVLALYLVWITASQGAGLASALSAGGLALVVGFALYAFNVMGAGDAKLFAAVSLFAGLEHLALLALVTAFVGGAMGLISLASRPTRALVILTLRGKGDAGPGIPYGVAIAVGAVLTVWAAVSLSMPLPWSDLVRHGISELPI